MVVSISHIFDVSWTWHLGYDLFVTLIAILMLGQLFFYSYNIYKLTYKRTILYFSIAFFLFLLEHMAVFGGRYYYYLSQQGLIAPEISQTMFNTMMGAGGYFYAVAGTLGLVFLVFTSFRWQNNWLLFAVALAIVTSIWYATPTVPYVITLQTIIAAILVIRILSNTLSKPTKGNMLYATGVSFLLLGFINHYAPWSFHFKFTAEVVFSVIAFGCIFLALREARIKASKASKQ